jgi:glycosyltransferase involved in cell wall biosynthesis
VGGLADFVADKSTGWLVPPSDPLALADRMAACIQSPETAQALGANARSLAIDRYSIERCRDDYERLYSSPRPTPRSHPMHENPLLV